MPRKKIVEAEPWERQPEETVKAFEAFVIYRDLGPERSITKVTQTLNKSRPLIGEWSSKYRWVERCAAFDHEQDRLHIMENNREIVEMKKRHAVLGKNLQTVGAKALAAYLKKNDAELEALTPAEIANLVKTGIELERKSRGEPETITEVREKVDANAATKAITELATDPEFLAKVQSAYTEGTGSGTAGGNT